jgi:branched-chain amino acid aminotransferase
MLMHPPYASPPLAPADAWATDNQRVWFDGELVAADSLHSSLTAHPLHYGDGVFECVRSYATADGGAVVFRLPEHLERMRKGAELLGISFDAAETRRAILTVLRANRLRDAHIRPFTWRCNGSIDFDVVPLSTHLLVATSPTVNCKTDSAVRLDVSTLAESMPSLKLCGVHGHSVLAKAEAKSKGFDEALLVDTQGYVVQCTGSNVFMVQDDRLVAIYHPDALPGITRDTLLTLTGAVSRKVSLAELLDAEEAILCGTAAEVRSIVCLDRRRFHGSAVATVLARMYKRVVRGEDVRHRAWLTHV